MISYCAVTTVKYFFLLFSNYYLLSERFSTLEWNCFGCALVLLYDLYVPL